MSTVDPYEGKPNGRTQWNDDKSKPKRQWTVMLYMAGDNNLSEECVYNLTEAKGALTEDDDLRLAVLAQFDPAGIRAQTKRFRLSSPKKALKDDATGWTASEGNTGEPRNLLDFVRWGVSEYPAEHYMVVLAGHGSGTDDDFLLRDDNPADALAIVELRWVFEQLTNDGQTIDILGMDTCLMNMAEVCFELLRTNVTYMVGSEGYAPNTGWPYKAILEKLITRIKEDEDKRDPKRLEDQPLDLARLITVEHREFYKNYISGGISVDQSVLEVKQIDEVKKRVFSLVPALIADLPAMADLNENEKKEAIKKRNALLLAHWDTQSYNGELFVDLCDFCDRLVARYKEFEVDSNVINRCADVKKAVEGMVKQTNIAGAAFQFSHGLSLYFPWATVSPNYRNLAFPKETGWLDYLMHYHNATRRDPRPEHGAVMSESNSPHRATVPTNKSRDGNVESMRNPPNFEYISPDQEAPQPNVPVRPPERVPDSVNFDPGQPTTTPG